MHCQWMVTVISTPLMNTVQLVNHPVNMPDLIQKRSGYGKLWPLWPDHIYAGSDFLHPIWFCSSKEGLDHVTQNWSGSNLDGQVLIRIKSRWPGFAQTNLVWKQASEQELSSLEYNWPATSFPVSDSVAFSHCCPRSYCAKPAWIRFGSGWTSAFGPNGSGLEASWCTRIIQPASGQRFRANPDWIGSDWACLLDWWAALQQWVSKLTPSLLQLVEFLGWKVDTFMPANSILDGPVTNLLSTLCILIEVLSCAHAKRRKGPINFKFGTLTDHFFFQVTAPQAWHWKG